MKRLLLAGLTLAALQAPQAWAQSSAPSDPAPPARAPHSEGAPRPEGGARGQAPNPGPRPGPTAGQPSYRYGRGDAGPQRAPQVSGQVDAAPRAPTPAPAPMTGSANGARAFGSGAPQGPAFYRYGRPATAGAAAGQDLRASQRPNDAQGFNPQGFNPQGGGRPGLGAQGYAGPTFGRPGYDTRRSGGDDRGRGGGRRFTYGGRDYAAFHVSPYRFPRGYDYRFYRRGERFPLPLLLPGYFLTDYSSYYLTAPPSAEYRWVRYGPDALLVDADTGQVVDTAYGVFDDGQDYGYAQEGYSQDGYSQDGYSQPGYGAQAYRGQDYRGPASPNPTYQDRGYQDQGYRQPYDPRDAAPYGQRPPAGEWDGRTYDDDPRGAPQPR